MSTTTTPGTNRHVHFIPASDNKNGLYAGYQHSAIICFVHNPKLVNLVVFDANGNPIPKASVTLRGVDEPPPDGDYCQWMPYHIEKENERKSRTEGVDIGGEAG